MNFFNEFDHKMLTQKLNLLTNKNEILNMGCLGTSILGKDIPIITLGDDSAKKSVLYVSTHHATENITTSVLVSFIEDYLSAYENMNQMCGINVRYLFKMRKIYIVPMLNPDGVEYRLNGINEDNPIKDRIIAYNGNEDFSKWNANARGVDLNHNYNASFEDYKIYERANGITPGKTKYSGEYPESEPETSALCNLIRIIGSELKGIITLHTQGEEIYYKSNGKTVPNTDIISRHVSRLTGYPLCETEGSACYGGLTDYAINDLNIPSYTLECGKGENPLDIKQGKLIYSKLRELLFTFPILF